MNTIAAFIDMVGVHLNVYREGSLGSLTRVEPSTAPLEMLKDCKFVSVTLMVKTEGWLMVTIKDSGPVMMGGLLARGKKERREGGRERGREGKKLNTNRSLLLLYKSAYNLGVRKEKQCIQRCPHLREFHCIQKWPHFRVLE